MRRCARILALAALVLAGCGRGGGAPDGAIAARGILNASHDVARPVANTAGPDTPTR